MSSTCAGSRKAPSYARSDESSRGHVAGGPVAAFAGTHQETPIAMTDAIARAYFIGATLARGAATTSAVGCRTGARVALERKGAARVSRGAARSPARPVGQNPGTGARDGLRRGLRRAAARLRPSRVLRLAAGAILEGA